MHEEWIQKIKHVAGVDNNGANALSQLGSTNKLSDVSNWKNLSETNS